jgi:hypothetical protein
MMGLDGIFNDQLRIVTISGFEGKKGIYILILACGEKRQMRQISFYSE